MESQERNEFPAETDPTGGAAVFRSHAVKGWCCSTKAQSSTRKTIQSRQKKCSLPVCHASQGVKWLTSFSCPIQFRRSNSEKKLTQFALVWPKRQVANGNFCQPAALWLDLKFSRCPQGKREYSSQTHCKKRRSTQEKSILALLQSNKSRKSIIGFCVAFSVCCNSSFEINWDFVFLLWLQRNKNRKSIIGLLLTFRIYM